MGVTFRELTSVACGGHFHLNGMGEVWGVSLRDMKREATLKEYRKAAVEHRFSGTKLLRLFFF